MKKTKFYGTAAISTPDPLVTKITFVFTDFRPNANKQAIAPDEADNIITTGKYKPVKISLKDKKLGNHEHAVPIGPITDISLEEDRIIANAELWKEHYPEVCKYLEDNQEKGIGFSWELYYEDSNIVDGVSWLKNCSVAGVAIVAKPAYGSRTSLLALAEEIPMEEEEKTEEILEKEKSDTSTTNDEQRDREIVELKKELAKAKDIISTYEKELSILRAEKTEASRRALFVSRGIPEDVFNKLAPTIVSIDDESFGNIVDVLASVFDLKLEKQQEKSPQHALATVMPEPASSFSNPETNLQMIINVLKDMKKNKER